jgi:hypothetical protein
MIGKPTIETSVNDNHNMFFFQLHHHTHHATMESNDIVNSKSNLKRPPKIGKSSRIIFIKILTSKHSKLDFKVKRMEIDFHSLTMYTWTQI